MRIIAIIPIFILISALASSAGCNSASGVISKNDTTVTPATSPASNVTIEEVRLAGIQDAASFGPVIAGKINGEDYLFGAIACYHNFARTDILVMDTKNPQQPEQLALLKVTDGVDIQDLELSGTTLYASTSKYLWVIDVSNPSTPREIARLSDIQAYDMSISGRYAYINELNSQIAAADISDSANPRVIYTLPVQRPGKILSVNSDLLCMAEDGIHIVDISSPASLKEVGLIPDPSYRPSGPVLTPTVRQLSPEEFELLKSQFSDFTVQGDKVYIASGSEGLKVFDISVPSAPQQIASYKTSESPASTRILVAGDMAYLFEDNSSSDKSDRLYILDISNPDDPRSLKSIELPTSSLDSTYHYNGFAKSGSYVYGFGDAPFLYSSSNPREIRSTPVIEAVNVSSSGK